MTKHIDAADLRMDTAGLYREEVVTDRRIGVIRILTQVLTPGGVLPLAFEIEASSLSQAIEKFPSGAEAAVERAIKELDALRREAAPSIIVPNSGLIERP